MHATGIGAARSESNQQPLRPGPERSLKSANSLPFAVTAITSSRQPKRPWVPSSASLPELDEAIGPWQWRVRRIYEATPKGVLISGEMTRWLALVTFAGYELGTKSK